MQLNNALLFQPATVADADRLVAMMEALYRHDDHPFDATQARRATLSLLGSPVFGRIWLICQAEEVVGYMVLTFGFSLEFGGRDALLDELFIAEPHRGKGFGRQTLQFAFEHCRNEGIRALHLEVLTGNDTAAAIYNRFGFKQDDRRLMTKWLDQPVAPGS